MQTSKVASFAIGQMLPKVYVNLHKYCHADSDPRAQASALWLCVRVCSLVYVDVGESFFRQCLLNHTKRIVIRLEVSWIHHKTERLLNFSEILRNKNIPRNEAKILNNSNINRYDLKSDIYLIKKYIENELRS